MWPNAQYRHVKLWDFVLSYAFLIVEMMSIFVQGAQNADFKCF